MNSVTLEYSNKATVAMNAVAAINDERDKKIEALKKKYKLS